MKLEKVADFAGIPTTITLERLGPHHGMFTYTPMQSTLKHAKVIYLERASDGEKPAQTVDVQWYPFLTSNGWHKVELESRIYEYVPKISLQHEALSPYTHEDKGEGRSPKPTFEADKEEAELVAQWLEEVFADVNAQFSFVE